MNQKLMSEDLEENSSVLGLERGGKSEEDVF
jgi:hypothetical protein